jgi:hypothetical protein
MTEVHQLNVWAGSRHIKIADAKDTCKRMDREESVIHVTHEVQDELYRLPADRGAEQRRVQTYKRNLGDIPTAPDIHNQNAGFLQGRLHDVLHDSMA